MPKINDVPTSKKDKFGNLVSDKNSLLSLYKQEYQSRLTPKPPLPSYKQTQILKEELFDRRMEISAKILTDAWTPGNIFKICKKLKNNKVWNQEGLIYELFKPSNAGQEIFLSLSALFNKVKDQQIIPEFMQNTTITSFSAGAGMTYQTREGSLIYLKFGPLWIN